MAITKTTSLGPNSVAINYAIGADVASVLTAISDFITTSGWEVHDSDSGTGTLVFKAPNADLNTFKYAMVDISDPKLLLIRVYEDWDAVNHEGVNEAQGGPTYGQRLSLDFSGYIYVFANAGWLIVHTKDNLGNIGSSTGSSWTGCIEIYKDNADEVPGEYPIHVFTNGHKFTGNDSQTPVASTETVDNSSSNKASCFSLCRTISDGVDGDAANYNAVGSLVGTTFNSECELHSLIPDSTNPLSANKDIFVLTPFAIAQVSNPDVPFHIRGRFYGIKLLSSNLGSFMDKVNIKCDDSFFFLPAGDEVEHHILTSSVDNNRFAIPA